MKFLSVLSTSLLALCRLTAAEEEPQQLAKRASLQQVSGFGSNPSGAKMFIYVPNNVASKPAVVVAIHHCQGTGTSYYQSTPYARLADQYGFIVIYPESPYSGTCWDVSSTATLTHNGGANSNSIANMVTYTLSKYSADASRVYVTGSSSGAMMTNVMAATYPDMFAAGSGNSRATPEQWAATRHHPLPPNYNETIKEWAGVDGYNYQTPTQTLGSTPISACTKYIFGERLQGIYCPRIGHTVPVQGEEDLKWFGIIGGGGGGGGGGGSNPGTPTTTTAAPSPTNGNGGGGGGCSAAQYSQCGGSGYTGCKTCAAPFTCKVSNEWYSQCL
ncbi:carbohydrate esterase family 1 protein [Apiospora saccharicola]